SALLLLLLAALAVALLGCDARGTGTDAAEVDAAPAQAAPDARPSTDGPPLDLRALAEGSYVGVVKVRLVPPEGSGMRPTSRNGTAGAGLDSSGRLVVVGDVDKEADAGFAADGRFHDGGWSGGTGEV